jgi:hypothetical protein
MIKSRAEVEELENDLKNNGPSIFDNFEENFRELEPESMKRPDGTYTGNPSLKGYLNGSETFGDKQ